MKGSGRAAGDRRFAGSARTGPRPRRDGVIYRADRAAPRAARRAEADRHRAGLRPRRARALRARGADDGVDRAPQRGPGLRRGRGGRPPLPRHALRARNRSAPLARARRTFGAGTRRVDRRAGRRRAGCRPRRRPRARDAKPANILINNDHAYLSDFGITRAGVRHADHRQRQLDRPSTSWRPSTCAAS